MNHDQTLRAVLFVVFLVVLPIGIYHRLQSQATRETLDRRQEGLFILATLRPMGAAFWIGLIAWMVDPGWMEWSSVSLPIWLRWTGVGVIAIACGLLVWTFLLSAHDPNADRRGEPGGSLWRQLSNVHGSDRALLA